MALSQDLKERFVRSVVDEGVSQADRARRLITTGATVSRTMKAYRERGTVAPKDLVPGPAPKVEPEHLDWLRARVEESPFLSSYYLSPESLRGGFGRPSYTPGRTLLS